MRFSIAYDEDATILTSSSGDVGSVDCAYPDLPEKPELVRHRALVSLALGYIKSCENSPVLSAVPKLN